MMRRLPALVLCAASAIAQQSQPARVFLIDDYRNVAFADLKALRDRGIQACVR